LRPNLALQTDAVQRGWAQR